MAASVPGLPNRLITTSGQLDTVLVPTVSCDQLNGKLGKPDVDSGQANPTNSAQSTVDADQIGPFFLLIANSRKLRGRHHADS